MGGGFDVYREMRLLILSRKPLPGVSTSATRAIRDIEGGYRRESLSIGARLEIYEGAPHATLSTEKERLTRDLLEFLAA